jgi:hypothetical protein
LSTGGNARVLGGHLLPLLNIWKNKEIKKKKNIYQILITKGKVAPVLN